MILLMVVWIHGPNFLFFGGITDRAFCATSDRLVDVEESHPTTDASGMGKGDSGDGSWGESPDTRWGERLGDFFGGGGLREFTGEGGWDLGCCWDGGWGIGCSVSALRATGGLVSGTAIGVTGRGTDVYEADALDGSVL